MATFNAKSITTNASDITLVSPASVKNKFCEIWPNAKAAL